MHNLSEYAVKPKYLVVHDPALSDSLAQISPETVSRYHYLSVPHKERVYEQFNEYIQLLEKLGAKPVQLTQLLSRSQRDYLLGLSDPNMMFTRDPVVTLPWNPGVFIKCRFGLASRQHEAAVMTRALTNYGLKMIASFDHDEYMEGGDVLPVDFQGRRILIVGFGSRTTPSAALKLAKQLLPEYADEIIGVRHDSRVLHLDTGFTVIDDGTILAAKGMFSEGFRIDKTLQLEWFNPITYAHQLGFSVIYIDKEDAIQHERCNVLPLGHKTFVSFKLNQSIRHDLQTHAAVELHEIEGSELAKAAGGVHCLSRPLY